MITTLTPPSQAGKLVLQNLFNLGEERFKNYCVVSFNDIEGPLLFAGIMLEIDHYVRHIAEDEGCDKTKHERFVYAIEKALEEDNEDTKMLKNDIGILILKAIVNTMKEEISVPSDVKSKELSHDFSYIQVDLLNLIIRIPIIKEELYPDVVYSGNRFHEIKCDSYNNLFDTLRSLHIGMEYSSGIKDEQEKENIEENKDAIPSPPFGAVADFN